MSMLEMKC